MSPTQQNCAGVSLQPLEQLYDSLSPQDQLALTLELEKRPASTATPTETEQAAETERCRADPGHFLDSHAFTYDPRLPSPIIPFRLYPKQFEFLRWLQEREQTKTDGLCEKSRDQGVTFLCGGYALHGWLFRSGFAAGFGSRKLELVDRLGDMDSIFEKIRFMLYRLPPWLLQRQAPHFRRDEHDNFARLINPDTGASITGEGGDQIGRGGRKSQYFVDEAAFLEHPARIDGALLANTECRIDVSTPNGPGNPFARKRFSGQVSVCTMHYRDDPRKDAEWVAKKKSSTDPVTWAQEYEIDYSASLEGICIPAAWVRSAVGLQLPLRGPCVAGFDVGGEGRDLSVIVPRRGPVVLPPHSWQGLLPIQSAHRAIDVGDLLGIETLWFDADGLGSGIKSTFQVTERVQPFEAVPVHTGHPPTETIWPDGKTSAEKFVNLRAEGWYTLRERFRRTHEHVQGLAQYPLDELISIPNHPQLIAELSTPLIETTETGKMRLESKEKMARRGIKSPDYGDALVLAWIPVQAKKSFWFV
jgi:phage terminase large subunit